MCQRLLLLHKIIELGADFIRKLLFIFHWFVLHPVWFVYALFMILHTVVTSCSYLCIHNDVMPTVKYLQWRHTYIQAHICVYQHDSFNTRTTGDTAMKLAVFACNKEFGAVELPAGRWLTISILQALRFVPWGQSFLLEPDGRARMPDSDSMSS